MILYVSVKRKRVSNVNISNPKSKFEGKFSSLVFGMCSFLANRCAGHVTPLYPQKLALTSPTSGDRSVGIVRSRTKATGGFVFGTFAT